MNLVRTFPSAKFICFDTMLWCDYHVTHTEIGASQNAGRFVKCGLTILIISLFSLCHLRITTQLRSGTVDQGRRLGRLPPPKT